MRIDKIDAIVITSETGPMEYLIKKDDKTTIRVLETDDRKLTVSYTPRSIYFNGEKT